MSEICSACNKVYSTNDELVEHHTRQPICKKWQDVTKNIQTYADDRLFFSTIGFVDEDYYKNIKYRPISFSKTLKRE